MDKKRKRRLGNRCLAIVLFTFLLISCKDDPKTEIIEEELAVVIEEPKQIIEFGFNLNNYVVKRDTIRSNETFGIILERNKIGYPEIFNIVEKTKDSFNTRALRAGKPYTLLCSKDSLELPKCFIYQPNIEDYVVVNFNDSIHAYTSTKPITYKEKTISGIITSSISQTLDEKGISAVLTNKLADEIYAWSIDFNRLQPGDRFKVIYNDKYISDSIYAGVGDVKAVLFEQHIMGTKYDHIEEPILQQQ